KVKIRVQGVGQFDDGQELPVSDSLAVYLVDASALPVPTTGAVKGVIRENDLPQPGLKVVLLDAKGVQVAETKTNDEGAYLFEKVVPAPARAYSIKPSTARSGAAPVQVAAGEPATADPISLLLGGGKK